MIRVILVIVIIAGILLIAFRPGSHKQGEHLVRPVTDFKAWNWQLMGQATGEAALEGDAVRCTIRSPGPEPNYVQLYQVSFPVQNGRTYRIRFSAKADRDRTIKLASSVNHMRYETVGLLNMVPVTRQWQTFQYIFVGENADGMPDRLPAFSLGGTPGTVWIKDVVVEVVK